MAARPAASERRPRGALLERRAGGGAGWPLAAAVRARQPPPAPRREPRLLQGATGRPAGERLPPLLPEGRRRPWRRRGEPAGAPPHPTGRCPPGRRRGQAAPCRWYVAGGGARAEARGDGTRRRGGRGPCPGSPCAVPRRLGRGRRRGSQEGLPALALWWLALRGDGPGGFGSLEFEKIVFSSTA